MDNFKGQIDEILKNKGAAPFGMTEEEFRNELFRRLDNELPLAAVETLERVANEILSEEMERAGRGILCRFAIGKSRKKCHDQPSCIKCPNYRPLPWRLQNPYKFMLNMEIALFIAALLSLTAAIIVQEIRLPTLGFWFGLVVVTRLHNIWLYRELYQPGKWKLSGWRQVKVGITRE